MDRYARKAWDLFEKEGYDVAPMERNIPIVRYPSKKALALDPSLKPFLKGYRKEDIWGLDLLIKNAERIVGVQVKSYTKQRKVVEAIKQVEAHAPFPPGMEIWIVFYRKGSRKPPDILKRGIDWGSE